MAQATTTFLQLCQQVARDSGVISGVRPTTTVGQTDQMKQIVEWVKDAWVGVQTEMRWPWMRSAFSGVTVAGTSTYSPTAVAPGWAITDWSAWVTDPYCVSMYLTSTGVSDEGFLGKIDYVDWRRKYFLGSQTNNRPTEYSVTPTGLFALGAVPDAVYTVRGEYWRVPQVFSADADVPTGLPEEYKNLIVYRALQQFGEYDEAANAVNAAARNYADMLLRMQRDLLPEVRIGGYLL